MCNLQMVMEQPEVLRAQTALPLPSGASPLHGEHLVGLGQFLTVSLVDNVCIVPHNGQQLEKYWHLVAKAAE
eukprot:10900291-Ditylum_brightwellii.AAC.1